MNPTRDACDYDRLIGALYQGPLEQTPWQSFLPLLRECLDALAVSLILRPPSAGDRGVILNQLRPGSDQQSSAVTMRLADPNDWQSSQYQEQFFALDPFVNLPLGKVVTLEQLMNPEALRSSDYYLRYLEPAGVFHIIGTDIGTQDGFMARLRVSRGPDEPPFEAEAIALCERILPHLTRAIELHARLNRIESERDLYAGAVEQLAVGTILLDERGRVLKANQLASRILEERDGLSLHAGQLELGNRRDTQELQKRIQHVIESALRHVPAVVEAMRVARPSGRAELGLIVRPVPQSEWAEGQNHPAVAIFISDPESGHEASQQTLSQLFGLTRAEAALATLLTRGLSLNEAADELGVSPHTARAQLKSVFAKTGVARQAELVRLLVKSVATLA